MSFWVMLSIFYILIKRKEVVFRSNINKDIPTIGNNVTVCANSLAHNKDVPSNSTVVGNPMRIISK